ncbi:hypothetical protein [Hwanghaeella sp.]|uniref:hypothetical protein n=1 Tax=Hwanghaeella sp. TaxID=2605943 RepID=UPI003CCC4518
MNASTATAIILSLALLVGAFIAWLVLRDSCEQDKIVCDCAVVLGAKKVGGVKVETGKDGKANVDVGAVLESSTNVAAVQVEAWTNCLEQRGKAHRIVNGVSLPAEPIGQVANRWKREQGLQIDLGSTSNKILQNLKIGPTAGPKSSVIQSWCTGEAGSCITCEPTNWQDAGVQVSVRLKANAPVEKTVMSENWSPLASEPWQIVDEQGTRYFYRCDSSE